MVATQHTQSLTDFRQRASETLERLNRTDEAEILTVNGEARAVLLSPAMYDRLSREAMLAHDITTIRNAMREIDDGNGIELHTAFDAIRTKLTSRRDNE